MLRISFAIALALFVFVTVDVRGQDVSQRTSQLVTALDKTKYKKKEKANVTVEVYVDIKNEPALRDAAGYAGNYESEGANYGLALQVGRAGAVSGNGHDSFNNDRRLNFTLRDASINGALLTGTKVYENGEQHKFEAVFVNRTSAVGKNVNEIATRDTKFGLGFLQTGTWSDDKNRTTNWTSRVFLERR